jgi:agmatinase
MTAERIPPESVLIAFPEPVIQPIGEGRVLLRNPALQTEIEGSAETVDALRFFEKPKRLGEAVESGGITPAVLEQLMRAVLVIDVNVLFDHVPVSMGRPVVFSEFVMVRQAEPSVAILGAPVDIATTHDPGARYGPAEVRQAAARFLAEPGCTLDLDFRRSHERERAVVDLGNVRLVPGEGIATYGMRLTKLVETVLDTGAAPIVIGGDHSITAPLLRAFSRKYPALGVIHFDAHHDLYLNPIGPYELLTHGTPFRYALKEPISYLLQLGLRTFERVPGDAYIETEPRLSYFSSRELQRLAPDKVFERIPRDVPCYISFDVDCLTPEQAPETGSPAPGGLTYYQALDLLDFVATNFNLVGADFVEVSATDGRHYNSAAHIVARYITHVILSSPAQQPLTGYYYNY